MAAEDGFLQDILAHPDDMAPRLIYADWLTEHGDAERGELIRVQIDLDREEREDRYSPRWRELSAREDKLLKAHKRRWSEPFRGLASFVRFYRGFVESATLFVGGFCRKGEQLWRLTPLREARLSFTAGGRATMADLAASPNLAWLRGLDLSNVWNLDDEGVSLLAASPRVSGLTELNLQRSRFSRPGLEALAASPHLAGLRQLDLSINRLDLEGLRALARSPHLKGLTELDLGNNPSLHPRLIDGEPRLGGALLDLFRDAPAWGRLASLNLGVHNLDDDGLTTLAGDTCLGGLTALRLDGNMAVGDEGVATVAQTPRLSRLRVLSLHNCFGVGDRGLEALAASRHLGSLQQLDFGGDPLSRREAGRITDAGVRALASSPNMAALRYLDLAGHRVADPGVEAILASTHLAQLGRLNLKNNPVSKDMQKALRKRYGPGVCTFSLG
jgi:uncharacterized protein (TIGR02996 family)